MFRSHFRSWVMMVPRKRQDSTESTGEPHRMTEAGGAGFFLKPTTISTVQIKKAKNSNMVRDWILVLV